MDLEQNLSTYQQFHRNGFLVYPDFYAASELRKSTTALNDLVRIAHDLGQTNDFPTDGIIQFRGATFVLEREISLVRNQWDVRVKRIVGCGTIHDELLQLTRKPRLLQIIGNLLQSSELDQIICQFHPKEPGDNVMFKAHRDVSNRVKFDPDWKDVNGTGSYVVAYIAIDSVTDNGGGLSLIPRSHLGYDLARDDQSRNTDIDVSNEEYITPLLGRGSILLMHPYLIHKSGPNKSDSSRYALLGGYACPGANNKPYPGGKCVHQRISLNGDIIIEDMYS